jgi:hypothetical protein
VVVSERARWWGRRVVVAAVLGLQAFLLVRGTWADHAEGAWRMFPESSDWRADIVRIAPDGTRTVISDAEWSRLVRGRGLTRPSVRHHADSGIDNQLAFLRAAMEYVTAHDGELGGLEATVTYWRNTRGPTTVVYRSDG